MQIIIIKNKTTLRVATGIITLSALVCLIGPYAADWNKTHIYNPRWPPHAKFHNGQTMLLGTFLALGSLWYTWKKSKDLTFGGSVCPEMPWSVCPETVGQLAPK